MSLQDRVRETFALDGVLSHAIEEFIPRDGQTEMAMTIARVIDEGGVLVAEAGTGIGKTFSYLVPVLLSGTRALISTATKTLQDQLFGRDLPRLTKALGLSVRTALLKGRGSYLCLHRLGMARQNPEFSEDRVSVQTLAKIEVWGLMTRTGDLAELPGLDERSSVIPVVTSSRDNCLGSQCHQFLNCFVNQARRDALAADVIVINHHLFFADLVVRESGITELLPSVQMVIFDEAHQLNETGIQFLGKQLSTGQLLDFARDMLVCGLLHARGLSDWSKLASDTEHAARDLRMLVGKNDPGTKLRWTGVTPEQVNASDWMDALVNLQATCTQSKQALETVSEVHLDLLRLRERVSGFIERFEHFSGECAVDFVRWLDVGTQLRLVESPLDIAETVQTRLLKALSEVEQRSWIFTSATLGQDAKLKWFTEPCGLGDAEILKVSSPFDFSKQAAVYIPQYFPKPSDPSHSEKVADFVAKSALLVGGRTLVLTTSLRALHVISKYLQQHFSSFNALEIIVQGQQTKRELIERFRQSDKYGGAGCILVASASFWEGVDIPGDALQLLVIDKLPFPHPSDPMVEARTKRLEAQGRSAFNSFFISEAAIALKQGAGRLIRRESDRGMLVICDTRLTSMGYGRRLLKAMPPMQQINSEEEFIEALQALPDLPPWI